MKARVSYFAVLLCVSGLTVAAKAADPNPPRFNGPFHQDRNPLLRQQLVTPIAHQHVGHTHHYHGSQPNYVSYGGFDVGGGYGPGYGSGYFPGYGVGTAYSSALFGEAEVLRGAGEYNLLTSQAWINRETARSMNMDNQKKFAATYFEKRRIHDDMVAAEKDARLARLAAGRAKIAAAAPVHQVALVVVKVNGKVQWPVGLLGETFAAEREQVSDLLNAESSDEVRQTISSVVDVMRTKLLGLLHAKQIKAMDYLAAKKFLASIEEDSAENQPIENVAQR